MIRRLSTVALLLPHLLLAQRPELIDPFDTVGPWTTYSSDGIDAAVSAAPGETGRALRLDVDFHGGAGYAVIRRPLPVTLPDNYRFDFRIRSTLPPNTVEVKFLDESGENVWWAVDRDFQFGDGWRSITVRKREVSFAWGPTEKRDLRRIATLEIAITAGQGGRGSVWFDELTLTTLPRADTTWPPRVRSVRADVGRATVGRLVDGDSLSSWLIPPAREATAIVDYGALREFGGMVLRWSERDPHRQVTVEVSPDRLAWEQVAHLPLSHAARDFVMVGEQDARYVRLTVAAGAVAAALNELELLPVEFGSDRTAWVRRMSRDARPGLYPRAFTDSLVWWTVAGLDQSTEEMLFDEYGRVEIGERAFSIEPFLRRDGRLFTWEAARPDLSMAAGVLPQPATRLDYGSAALDVEAWPAGTVDAAVAGVRYTVHNRDSAPRRYHLLLAVRPLQVNPPSQFLNIAGGAGYARQIRRSGSQLMIDDRVVRVYADSVSIGTARGWGDSDAWFLAQDSFPGAATVIDTLGFAEGLIRVSMNIPARAQQSVVLAASMHAGATLPDDSSEVVRSGNRATGAISLPGFLLGGGAEVEALDQVVRRSAGFILVNRDGPAIQPGSRAYARSWIRDGALTSSALLRLGIDAPVREFLRWFSSHLFPSGKVPCCVDRRGADPVPENDSHGELLYLAAEYHRRTADRPLIDSLWPALERAAMYMDSLRHSRMGPRYQADSLRAYYGLLPESISHEGYSAHPVHSFWDQLWGVRGFHDAAYLASVVGDGSAAGKWAAVADSFQSDVLSSYRAAMRLHAIDYLPGSVELGDFDATSTSIAGDPVRLFRELPQFALARTFLIHDSLLVLRRSGQWDAYTPYEARNIGAKVRLGRREAALAELRSLMAHRRPAEWDQWPEVIYREARSPKFLGDLPHTWVASDVIRSTLDLFAYEDEAGSLILLGGVPDEWLTGDGLTVRIPWSSRGSIHYTARLVGDAVELDIASLPSGTRWRVAAPRGRSVRVIRDPGGRLDSE